PRLSCSVLPGALDTLLYRRPPIGPAAGSRPDPHGMSGTHSRLGPPASWSFSARGTGVEFNRNHYFMAGVVFLLLGIQLRFVESYTLNESTTQALGSYFAASEQPS